jgi:carboxypeptidase D
MFDARYELLIIFQGNGLQGFQTPIADDSFIVDGVGAYGTMHSERGLTYYEVALSGHM